jgi:simple sugar transport system ATP-binding protein
VVELIDITKRFGPVVANDRVTVTLHAGRLHAIVGENGAGKTTLVNALYGLVQPDSGTIRLHGEPVTIDSPDAAIRHRIGMVHQHFMLVPSLTVAENVVLGRAPTARGLVDQRRAAASVSELAERYGLHVDPTARVRDLSVGRLQRVEIIKALHRGADVLILDEPTAVLTPQEAAELGRTLRALAAQGKAVVFITHKLKEVMAASDEVTVMRRGRVAGRVATSDTSERELARMMVGRDITTTVPKGPAQAGKPVLQLERVSVRDDRRHRVVTAVDLTVHAGTIVGIAGVEGNGQSELIEAIAGLRDLDAGRVLVDGRDISRASPRDRRKAGVAHIPEDRLKRGVAAPASIEENLLLNVYDGREYSRFGILRRAACRRYAQRLVERFGIAAASTAQPVSSLSGGNMQKVVVAREIAEHPSLVLASQPTRGVDIGAIENIHRQLVALRDGGAAILLVSAELDEILALADRIVVIYGGEIVARVDPAATSEIELGRHMMGVRDEVAA